MAADIPRRRGGATGDGTGGETGNKNTSGRDTVEVCPECGTATLWYRTRSAKTPLDATAPKWRCKNAHEFDEPHERENRGSTRAGQSHSGGQALIDADPEEWP